MRVPPICFCSRNTGRCGWQCSSLQSPLSQWGEGKAWHLLTVPQSEYVQQGCLLPASQHLWRRESCLCSHYWKLGMINKPPSHSLHSDWCGVGEVGKSNKFHSAKLGSCWFWNYVFLMTLPILFFLNTAHCFFTWPTPISPLRFRSEFISSFSYCTYSSAPIEIEGCLMSKFLWRNLTCICI